MRNIACVGAVVAFVLAACAGEPKWPERHLHGDIPLRVANLTGKGVCELIVVERLEDGGFSPDRAYLVDPLNNAFRDGFHRDYAVKPGHYRVKAQTCALRAGEIQYERAFDLDVQGPTKLVLLPSDKPDGSGAALSSEPLVYKKDRYGHWVWTPADGEPVPPDPKFVAVVDRSLNESTTATQASHYLAPLSPSPHSAPVGWDDDRRGAAAGGGREMRSDGRRVLTRQMLRGRQHARVLQGAHQRRRVDG